MKSLVKLPFIKELAANLQTSPQFIQVILGPRQVGKTTSVNDFLKTEFNGSYHSVSADGVFNSSQDWIREQWLLARQAQRLLVIDEIQKIENWAETVKALWEEEKKSASPIRCVLLGSSSLDIHRGLTESLAGRFQLIRAHHWNVAESQAGYGLDFETYMEVGGYPGSYDLQANRNAWASYVKTSIVEVVIEKDILLNNTVKSQALFRQAFEILLSYPAQEVSYTKLLGQLQERGNVEIIKHYLRLYEGAFLIRTLEKFTTNKIQMRSSSPKILLLCPAFYYLGLLNPYDPTERGRAFELLVGSQLVRTGLPLYYWREKDAEVDFVVKKGKTVWAIEVKSGRRRSMAGIEAFLNHFPSAKPVLLTLENYVAFEADPVGFLEALP